MSAKTLRIGFVGRMAVVILSAWLCAGCAGVSQYSAIAPESDGATWIAGVPFFPDDGDECGPATMAGLLSFWGAPVSQVDLATEVYDRSLRGTLPIDLWRAAADRGFVAQLVRGTMSDLQAEISAGRPVIVQLNLGTGWLPIGHYVLVTGFDENSARIIAHSGTRPNRVFPYAAFLRNWAGAGNWMLTVRPGQSSMETAVFAGLNRRTGL
ncbi:MAG TPA: C39 family peptidase [Nitrospiraceae bacterium]|nr:C39 family peptidase [Nitrospiraceae bacterium]